MVSGQHHHVSPRYPHQFAAHAAWLEDHRRLSNEELVHFTRGLALRHPVSRNWKGYWQRNTLAHNAARKREPINPQFICQSL